MAEEYLAVHLLIKGKVQGVFYRDTAKRMAGKIGVMGWVKNTPDGHVEAFITGSEEQIAAFIKWAHQGPPRAVVTGLTRTEKDPGVFEGFTIRE